MCMQVDATEERLKSVEHEKDYYKSRANEAMEDLDRVKRELSHLQQALNTENQSLVSELAHLRMRRVPGRKEKALSMDEPPTPELTSPTSAKRFFDGLDIVPPATDVWAQSRLRQRKMDKKKRGEQGGRRETGAKIHRHLHFLGVQDLNEVN